MPWRDRPAIALQMAFGVLVSASVLRAVWWLSPQVTLPLTAAREPRATALALSIAVAALPLFVLVSRVAFVRFTGPSIDGGDADPRLLTDRRVLVNTLEQTGLFAAAAVVLVVGLPAQRIALPVLQALAFGLYRALFWWGYRWHPRWRAFGFATTFYSTVMLMGLGLATLYG